MENPAQPKCRKCGTTELAPYGWKWQNSTGWLRVWKCKKCGPLTRTFVPLDPGYKAKAFVLSANEMLIKAVAVYALGVPLKVVEEKTHVKSETVSALLKRVIYETRWSELEQRILTMRPRIVSKGQLDWLHEMIQAEVDTPGELHTLGLVKAAEYRKRKQRNNRKIERILRAEVVDPKTAQKKHAPFTAFVG